MTLDALMRATAALVNCAIFRNRIGTSVHHVVIVTNPLFLFIPSTVPVQPCRQIGFALPVAFASPVLVSSCCVTSGLRLFGWLVIGRLAFAWR